MYNTLRTEGAAQHRVQAGDIADHDRGPWYVPTVETIAISKFKATCLAALERVRKTGRPLLVTRRGVPVAQVVPPPRPSVGHDSAFGVMSGTAEELADILEPLPAEDWEALR